MVEEEVSPAAPPCLDTCPSSRTDDAAALRDSELDVDVRAIGSFDAAYRVECSVATNHSMEAAKAPNQEGHGLEADMQSNQNSENPPALMPGASRVYPSSRYMVADEDSDAIGNGCEYDLSVVESGVPVDFSGSISANGRNAIEHGSMINMTIILEDNVNVVAPDDREQVIHSVQARRVDGCYIRKSHLRRVLFGLLLVAIIVGVAVAVSRSRNRNAPTVNEPVQAPKSLITSTQKLAVSLPDYTQETLRKEVLGDTSNTEWYTAAAWSSDADFVPKSPQGKAWQWLVSDPSVASWSLNDLAIRFALATFYFATNGPNWKDNAKWLSTDHFCDWYSSDNDNVLTRDRYVKKCQEAGFSYLILADNGLKGSLPPELELLTDIYVLRLQSNLLQGSIPDVVWRSWRGLYKLELEDNQLRGSLPSSIGSLTALTQLYLQSNLLSGTIPSEISKLTALLYFSVSNNLLTGRIPTGTERMRKLGSFEAANNKLVGPIPSELFQLQNMQVLDISMNQISGSIPTEIGSSRLVAFNVSYNYQLTKDIPTEIGEMSPVQAKALHINNCSFTGSLPSELGNLVGLLELDVSGNHISGALPSEIFQLSQLTYLRLFGTDLTGSIPQSMCQSFSLANANTEIMVDCTHIDCNCNCTCV
ncbi:hypothetical protein MPSEU_000981000 [Mayamaea pseudoterrestris]|nr:hypothetical protein MPSEU_000981000 [Mayamaea pseudoterrestris]